MPLFKKEIKKFNSWLVLIILVLFLIIIDMIIFIKARNESEALISLIENSDNELNKSLDSYVTGIANDINRINNLDPSKWEIYQNKQYGIAFRYPQYLKKMSIQAVMRIINHCMF